MLVNLKTQPILLLALRSGYVRRIIKIRRAMATSVINNPISVFPVVLQERGCRWLSVKPSAFHPPMSATIVLGRVIKQHLATELIRTLARRVVRIIYTLAPRMLLASRVQEGEALPRPSVNNLASQLTIHRLCLLVIIVGFKFRRAMLRESGMPLSQRIPSPSILPLALCGQQERCRPLTMSCGSPRPQEQ